jgi:uncharacterized protein (TIGR02466 family)
MNNNLILDRWFSNPVWESELSDIDNQSIIDYAYNLQKSKPGILKSNREGWQCSDLKNPPPSYLKLIDTINKMLLSVHQSMGLKVEFPSYIQGSWINVNPPNSYNLRHLHPRSLFSGVYYLKIPSGDSGDLIFYRDHVVLSYLPSYIVEEWNDMTSGMATYKPKTNMLLIFPSWLEHSVTANLTDDDRISISFNTNYDF